MKEKECQALTLLHENGWNLNVLEFSFYFDDIEYHITNFCSHKVLSVPDIEQPQQREHDTTLAECTAMKLLHEEGMDKKELKMIMHLSSTSEVTKHINGECHHIDITQLP